MSWGALPKITKQVKAGETSAVAMIEGVLKRAEASQSYYALLEINPDALEQAKQVDARLKAGEDVGALAGIPFVAKDNFLTHNTKTTAASKLLDNFQSPYQATAIERLEAEGAILVGKVNLDEFAHGSSTENSAYGPTKNPHDKTRVPGGSSGGSAAAVALDITPFALGTDTGGSIRLPASFCGVVGYKPTYGLVSRSGVIAMASSTDVVGPMTRSVSDSAYVLDVLSGVDPLDSTTISREDSYRTTPMKDVSQLKVGVIAEHLGPETDETVRTQVQAAIDTFTRHGAAVSDVHLSMNEAALAAYYIIAPAEISSNLARYDGVKYGVSAEDASDLLETYLQSRGGGFGEEPKRRILTGTYVLSSGYQDAYYKQAQKVRTLIREEYQRLFDEVDILIGPTVPTTAFPLGEKQDPLSMYMTDSMTIAANLAGIPAISLPAASSDGLPVGIQLQAAQRQDKRLLDIAAWLEGAL